MLRYFGFIRTEKSLEKSLFQRNFLHFSFENFENVDKKFKMAANKNEVLEILDEKSSARIYIDPKEKRVSVFLGREDRKSLGIEWLRVYKMLGRIAEIDPEIAFKLEDRLAELRDPSCIYNILDQMEEYATNVVEREKDMSIFDVLEGKKRKSIPLASSKLFASLYNSFCFITELYPYLFDILKEEGYEVCFDERRITIRKEDWDDDVEINVYNLNESSLIHVTDPSRCEEVLNRLQEIVFEEKLESSSDELEGWLDELFAGLEFIQYNVKKGRYTVKLPSLAIPIRWRGDDFLVEIDENKRREFARKLSEQMKFVYEKSMEIGDNDLFKEFCDEVKLLYPKLFPLALEITKKDSEDVKKLLDKYGRVSLKKLIAMGGIAALLVGAATVAYLFSQDKTPPTIKIKDKKQVDGKLLLTAEIKDKSGVAGAYALVKYPSGKTLNITLTGNDSIYTLTHPILLNEEGNYLIKLFAKDTKGNIANVSLTHGFYDDPVIKDVSYIYEPPLLKFNVTADDLGGISKVILQILNKSYTLSPIKVDDDGRGIYGGSIEVKTLSKNIDYKVLVFDKFNRSSSLTGNITLTPKQVFIAWAKSKGYDVKLSSQLYDNFQVLRHLFEKGRFEAVEDILKVAQINGSAIPKNLAYQILDQIERGWGIKSKDKIAEMTFDLLDDLKIYDLKRKTTVYILPNYTAAIVEQYLPQHDDTSILNLIKAAELNPDIVDFTPVIIKVDFKLVDKNVPIYEGSWKYLDKIPNNIIINPSEDEIEKMFKAKKDFSVVYVIKSNNIPRDVWMICEHLRRTPYVLKHPEMFEAFSIKVQQNAWDIFDNPNVKIYHHYKPSDEYIWKEILIPHWEYYWSSSPQGGNVSKRITVFPWYDSNLMKKIIKNKNDRKIALMYLFELPSFIGDLDDWHNKYHGITAMKYFVNNLGRVHDEIMSGYPDATFTTITGKKVPYINRYIAWITDRGYHGLENSMKQFLGPVIIEDEGLPNLDELYIQKNPSSVNTYLSKKYPPYKLIKYAFGYINQAGHEIRQYVSPTCPIGFRSLGIPYSLASYNEHYAKTSLGYACGYDSAFFGLPDDIVSPIKEGKYGKFLVLPGNGINPISSPIDGVIKDLQCGHSHSIPTNAKYAEIYLPLRGLKVYLFRGGSKG